MRHCRSIPALVPVLGADEKPYKTLLGIPLDQTSMGHQHRRHIPQQRESRGVTGLKHQSAVARPSFPSPQPPSPSPRAPPRTDGHVLCIPKPPDLLCTALQAGSEYPCPGMLQWALETA